MSRFIKDGDILNVGDVITITNNEVLPFNWVGRKVKITAKESSNMYYWRFINNINNEVGNSVLWDLFTFIYVKAIKDNVKRKSISWL